MDSVPLFLTMIEIIAVVVLVIVVLACWWLITEMIDNTKEW